MRLGDALFLLFLAAAVAPSAPDDADLLVRLQARDPEALRKLYDRYGRIAFSLILRIVQDRGIAEDLLQESFLRVWTRVASFQPGRGALGAWLLAVARNQALDYKRSLQGRNWSLTNGDMEQTLSVTAAEDQVLDSLELRRLQSAFAELPAVQKQILELAYFDGLSQSEIAGRLQLPLGSVKTWTRSALNTLRRLRQ